MYRPADRGRQGVAAVHRAAVMGPWSAARHHLARGRLYQAAEDLPGQSVGPSRRCAQGEAPPQAWHPLEDAGLN